jgi:hypothetical protein
MSRARARDRDRKQAQRRARLGRANVRSLHEDDPDKPAVYYVPDEIVTVAGQFDSILADLGDFAEVEESRIDEDRAASREDRDEVPVVIKLRDGDPLEVIARLNEARGSRGEGAARVALNHVLTLAPPGKIGPESDPWPAQPAERGDEGPALPGSMPKIGVVDTGVWEPMPNAVRVSDPGGPEHVDPVDVESPTNQIDYPGAGHGGFIAGVISHNFQAGSVDIVSRRGFVEGTQELLTEESVAGAGNGVALDARARIINLSLGTYADGEALFLRDAVRQWVRDGCLIVAAAGNEGISSPWYPAAFTQDPELAHGVVAVGALESRLADGPGVLAAAAPFSNHGPWVTAWAPGADVVSAYPQGLQFPYGPAASDLSDPFAAGLAHWDGTSFAAPFAAAEIARYAAEHGFGDNVQGAWRALKGESPYVVFWPTWDRRRNRFDPDDPDAGRYSELPGGPSGD